MPTRRLPQANAARLKALSTAKTKNDALAAGARFLTTPTQTRLNAVQPLLNTKVAASGLALSNQSGSTVEVELAKATAKLFANHYYQVFNLGVARGTYPKAHRALYMLDVNSDVLPPLATEADITLQGERIIAGETARVAAGGSPMFNPTVDEVAEKHAEFTGLNSTQGGMKDEYDEAQQTITDLIPEADAVIKKIWDEVETFYNEETPASMRRKAREWGVFYESNVTHTINAVVKNAETLVVMEGVTVEIIETGLVRTTIDNGTATLETKASDEVTLRFSKTDFITQEAIVTFVDGQIAYPLTVNLVHV